MPNGWLWLCRVSFRSLYMPSSQATLVGFHDQGNLGLGYLGAVLEQHGFKAELLDFRAGKDAIFESVRSSQPLLVGFSLIFQYYLAEFQSLARDLRQRGVHSHFCIGGHFATLRFEELLARVPEIDSVVRCEGELTLLALMRRLAAGKDWRGLAGLAYREGERVVATVPRPLIDNLDDLPYPLRDGETLAVLGKGASPILAGRGCARNCSFCSIRQFYLGAPGKKIRRRSPNEVVREMQYLFAERNVSIFLFQDDDFPVHARSGRGWIDQFAGALTSTGLAANVIWKISCRADEVDFTLFATLRRAGLYMVYLGLESGTDEGLKALNKQLTVADNLRAVRILKDLDLSIAYGFMLFDPSSSFASVQHNIAFLRQICDDGMLPVVACRMLPYAGTPIEDKLRREGRLRGDVLNPDYAFREPRLDRCFHRVNAYLTHFMQGTNALSNQIGWAWQEYWIMRRLFPVLPDLDAYRRFLQAITSESNAFFLDTIQRTVFAYPHDQSAGPGMAAFEERCGTIAMRLMAQRDDFMVRNQASLLASLDRKVV
jgi:radical SAM superfamily enzyme YgiQ (UPF0313 family)